MPDIHRRSFLKASGAVWTAVVAGCSSSPSEEPTEEASPEESTARDEATTVESARVEFGVELVAEGFHLPWAVAFLPGDTRLLVTERRGTLNLVDREDGTVGEVTGTPQVFSGGQGGLLDLAVHPAFPEEPWVYLTYTAANGDGESTTHLGRGHLDLDDPRLDGFEVVHVAEPFVETKGLYGSRVVFGADDLVYVTVGSRSDDDLGPDNVAQDPGNELGATLRLEADGVVPDDNPFVEGGGADAVFSYGHRNAQGMTVHPGTGALWQSEHGEKDGDELNMIEPGGNYGWPVADYGCTYEDGAPIGDEPHERDDVVDPVYHWACGSGGFPPSGMTFYDGDAFPGWRGDLFVGNLAGQYLGRFAVDGRDVAELDPLLADRGWRVRDVAVAPESGHLYVVVDDEPVPLVRLVPEGG